MPLTPYGQVADFVLAREGDALLLLPAAAAQREASGVHGSLVATLRWSDESAATHVPGAGPLLPASNPDATVLAPGWAPAPLARAVSEVGWRMTGAMGTAITCEAARRTAAGRRRRRPAEGPLWLATSPVISPPVPSWPR